MQLVRRMLLLFCVIFVMKLLFSSSSAVAASTTYGVGTNCTGPDYVWDTDCAPPTGLTGLCAVCSPATCGTCDTFTNGSVNWNGHVTSVTMDSNSFDDCGWIEIAGPATTKKYYSDWCTGPNCDICTFGAPAGQQSVSGITPVGNVTSWFGFDGLGNYTVKVVARNRMHLGIGATANFTVTLSDTCTDSDAGTDYYVVGGTTWWQASTGTGGNNTDTCISATDLREYDCVNATTAPDTSSTYTCAYGCSGGKCNSCDPNTGNSCTSVPNVCGAVGTGTIQCSGICDAVKPPDPANFGNICNTPPNSCGTTVQGTIQCDGTCSEKIAPPDPLGLWQSCPSGRNDCGAIAYGTITCSGCDAVTPPNPSNFGKPCTSSPNACGATNGGTTGCTGACDALPPPNPPGYGAVCSATNGCGGINYGNIDCSGSCTAKTPPVVYGGIVPCGRKCDDPTTPWNELRACDICSLFLMGQLIIEFFVRLAGLFALIAIAIGGFLYIFAAGNTGAIDKAKQMIKYALIGFTVVFIAWAVVNSILTAAGYIDPMSGEWYAMECNK